MNKKTVFEYLLFATIGTGRENVPRTKSRRLSIGERFPKAFLFILLCGITPVHAEPSEALHLLEKMTVAEQTLNYEGTVVYQHGRSSETMQIVHSFDQYGERERLSSLAGSPREMVRDDRHVFFILPTNKFVLVESRNTMAAEGATTLFSTGDTAFYELSLKGSERIAGYSCQVLGITPKDQYRYGYRLCIENETGLLLKSQTFDGDGLPREQMTYTHLRLLDSIPTESLQTTLHEEDFTLFQSSDTREGTSESPASKDSASAWKLSEKPPGFSVTRNEMRQIASSEQPIRYIILEDGIASVSIFIERLTNGAPQRPAGVTRSGALSTFSKIQDDFMVMVIGEVPASTVEMIAQALHYQPAEKH